MKPVSPYIAAMEPYDPGMAADENPSGSSPVAVEAMKAAIGGVPRYPDGTLEINAAGLRRIMAGLRELGLAPVPSEANFEMLPFPTQEQAAEVFEELLPKGEIVRPLGSFGLPEALRITIGTPEENELCLQALEHVLRQETVLQ